MVVIEGAGMWRWAFLPPQFQDRDELYGSIWRSLVRWLVANVGLLPSQRMALRTDKLTFSTDENATATLLIRENQWTGEAPWVELSGAALGQAADRSSACRAAPRPANTTCRSGGCRKGNTSPASSAPRKDELSGVTAFDVQGNLKERLDVAARPDVMKFIAAESGGAVLEDNDVARLQRQFDEHLARSRPERVTRVTAWDRWWVLIFAFWHLGRRLGASPPCRTCVEGGGRKAEGGRKRTAKRLA